MHTCLGCWYELEDGVRTSGVKLQIVMSCPTWVLATQVGSSKVLLTPETSLHLFLFLRSKIVLVDLYKKSKF